MAHKITDDEIIKLLKDGVSNAEIARNNGMDIRTFYRRKAKLVKKGWSPEHDMTHSVPDGYQVKGTSTLYGDDGNLKIQWVKTSIDAERQAELMKAAVSAMCEEIPKYIPVDRGEVTCDKDLLNAYIICDYHFGLLVWHEENAGNESWDMHIAEDMLYRWFELAIIRSPQAATGIFAQAGDFLHFDGLRAVTPTSGHILDADTRFQKLVRVVIRVIRRVIEMLLQKHEKVVLLQCGGNHDEASTAWMRELFFVFYEDEPRVEIDRGPMLYVPYEFGNTSLFFHHHHKKRVKDLDHVLAAMFREIYGRTKYHYSHGGHFHNDVMLSSNLMHNEMHQTLAAPDNYASSLGFTSGRTAKVITYHRKYGEYCRNVITADEILE